MSIRELLPPPTTAGASSPCVSSARSDAGRALSSDVVDPEACGGGSTSGVSSEVPHDPLTPTTPASSDPARGFGLDLSAMLYGGGR